MWIENVSVFMSEGVMDTGWEGCVLAAPTIAGGGGFV